MAPPIVMFFHFAVEYDYVDGKRLSLLSFSVNYLFRYLGEDKRVKENTYINSLSNQIKAFTYLIFYLKSSYDNESGDMARRTGENPECMDSIAKNVG